MNAIETQQWSVSYGRTEAVRDLNLIVPEGSIYALLGPNGAGKSTTLQSVMNLIPAAGGQARLFGRPVQEMDWKRWLEVGYLSENQQLPLELTVQQFLTFCRPLYPTWDRGLEKELLARFQLPPGRKLRNLSRGMIMKVGLVSVLAFRPRLLILDEPFSGLDPVVRDDLVRGLIDVVAEGRLTVFISSHDIPEIESVADHVGFLSGGTLRHQGLLEELQSRYRLLHIEGASAAPRRTSWINCQVEAHRLVAVETDYSSETETYCREHYKEAEVVAKPMGLRDIYVAWARNQENGGEK